MLILGFGLIAAFGRVIQLGGFGEIPRWEHYLLEVVVETSRLMIILFVLGTTNIRRGASYFVRFFTSWTNMKTYSRVAIDRFRKHWLMLTFNFLAFMTIAFGINILIDQLAYETCLLLSLKSSGILAAKSSEWTILLFFKNLTVIPFTLVFETVLLLWLTNRTELTKNVKA